MKVVPLGDKIVVRPATPDAATRSGIALPESTRERPQQGRVLSIGDGRLLADGERVPHQVREGDRVLYQKFAGTEIAVDGETLLIMSEDEILAVMP